MIGSGGRDTVLKKPTLSTENQGVRPTPLALQPLGATPQRYHPKHLAEKTNVTDV